MAKKKELPIKEEYPTLEDMMFGNKNAIRRDKEKRDYKFKSHLFRKKK